MIFCKSCKYWNKYVKMEFIGECRKNPPLSRNGKGYWASTEHNDGCHSGKSMVMRLTEQETRTLEDPSC